MLTPCMLIAYEILSCIIIGVVGYTPDIDTNDGYIQHYKLNSRRFVNAENRLCDKLRNLYKSILRVNCKMKVANQLLPVWVNKCS